MHTYIFKNMNTNKEKLDIFSQFTFETFRRFKEYKSYCARCLVAGFFRLTDATITSLFLIPLDGMTFYENIVPYLLSWEFSIAFEMQRFGVSWSVCRGSSTLKEIKPALHLHLTYDKKKIRNLLFLI